MWEEKQKLPFLRMNYVMSVLHAWQLFISIIIITINIVNKIISTLQDKNINITVFEFLIYVKYYSCVYTSFQRLWRPTTNKW